jgi:putative DNA primase/helicase
MNKQVKPEAGPIAASVDPFEGVEIPAESPAEARRAGELDRLALLSPIDYDREREAAAEALGCRVSTLDAEVARRRKGEAGAALQGRAVELPDADPWPHPVDGAQLLEDLAATIRDHVAMPAPAADAAALWCAVAWCFDVFGISPRLAMQSPEKGSGKSTLLDLVSMLVPRPLLASSVSAASIFRVVERFKPTLLLDEADQWMSGGDDERLGILNAGHRRGAPAVRCVGDDAEPRAFDVFAPVALASIGRLPPTLQDRSIVIALRRALPEERRGLEAVRTDRPERFAPLRSRCRRWADDNRLHLADADPVMPESLSNRRADNWRPLLTIAEAAGGEWPARVRLAVDAIEDGGEDGGDTGMRLQLLADIRAAFGEIAPEVEAMATSDLVARLVEMEASPWGEMPHGGRAITPHTLARLLRPWGVKSSDAWLGGRALKAYKRADFHDLFARYLPSLPPFNRERARNELHAR